MSSLEIVPSQSASATYSMVRGLRPISYSHLSGKTMAASDSFTAREAYKVRRSTGISNFLAAVNPTIVHLLSAAASRGGNL